MPSYDYKCRDCDATNTLFTSIDKELTIPVCPNCKTEMVRDYGGVTVTFKGAGFYSNGG